MLAHVALVPREHIPAGLDQLRRTRVLHPPEGLDAQVVTAHPVEDDHVEGGRRRPLLVEAADVEAVGRGPAVRDLVDRALVSGECEYDRPGAPGESEDG